MSNRKEPRIWIPLAGLAVIGVAIIWKPFLYVTEPGNATVVFNLFTGIQAGRVEQPGVSWITPGVDSPVTYNTRTRIWQFTDTPNAPNLASNAISVNTSDGQAFVVDVYVALKPNLEVLDVLHSKIGPRYMETIVVPLVRSKVRDVSAGFDSEAYFAKADRAMMEQQMLDLITQEMPQATVNGSSVPLITIEEVFLGTPRFPQALKDSLEQKQVASITAQTAGVRAQIQEKETMRRLILAEANQTAIELQGQAAAGNAQLADLLFYERLEDRISAAKSQGQTSPLKVIRVEGEDATIFLNVDPQRAAAAQ